MSKLKLLVLNMSIISIFTMPLFVYSCSINKNNKYIPVQISGIDDYLNTKNAKNVVEQKIETWKNEGRSDKLEKLKEKIILITAGGKVNDKSFNQLAWEAISKLSIETNNEKNSYFEVTKIIQSEQNNSYDYALAKDYKVWVLTGFQQQQFLKNWLSIGNNKTRFIESKITILAIDWYDEELANEYKGQILGLNFRTQEASFVIGYSASKYLANKYPGIENKNKRILNSFAGGDFSGATNFNYGFYEGIRRWNSEQKDISTKVRTPSNEIDLGMGFVVTNDSVNKVNYQVDTNATITMSVAGSLISPTIDRIKEKNKSNSHEQLVIGVDTDQSIAFPNDKKLILTSSEKRIGIAIYKALIFLLDLDIDNSILGDNFIEKFQFGLISENIDSGYDKDFVDSSKSTLENEKDRDLINKYLLETKEVFFDNNKLKPPKEYSEEEKKQSAFDIKNVRVGYMTVGNKENYFLKAIKEINEWDK